MRRPRRDDFQRAQLEVTDDVAVLHPLSGQESHTIVRAAAADADGDLWVSLAMPYTYVYDASGDKRRTVQFRAAGIIAANSLFFTADRRLLVTPGCYAFRPS